MHSRLCHYRSTGWPWVRADGATMQRNVQCGSGSFIVMEVPPRCRYKHTQADTDIVAGAQRAGRMIHLNELIVQCRKQSQSIEASPFKTTSFSQFSPPHQCAVAQRSKTFTFGSCEMRRTSAKVKRKERNTLPRFKKTGFCFGVPIYCLLFKNTHAHNRGRTQNSFAFLPK